jgi:AraC-like DNA-binding protein
MSSESKQESCSEKLAHIHFSSADVPTKHQFEAWQQFTSPVFDVEPVKETTSYSYSCTSYCVDQLIVSQASFDTVEIIRPPQKLSGSDSDFLTLQYYGTGKMQGSLDNGTPLLLQPDCVSMLDLAHAYRGCGQTDHVTSIIIPRYLITNHDTIYTCAPMFSWAVNSPQGRLVLMAMQTIWQQSPHMTQADAPIVSAGMIGLLNGLLANQWNDVARQHLQATMLQTMQHYIQANLHRPNLGVEHLCKTYHCSRSTIYRLFQPLGGLMFYIREQRLMRCYDALKCFRTTTQQRVGVQAIAEQWGFTNYSNFSRIFKRRFGISPRELKALSWATLSFDRDKANGDWKAIQRWQHWLTQTA